MLRRLPLLATLFVLSCVTSPDLSSNLEGEKEHFSHRPWREEIIYQLLTDRFSDGDPSNNYGVKKGDLHRYQGGDWRGVIKQIPYLKRLGVTAIWISPIVKNIEEDAGYDAYHGYWPQDFYQLNPHFGDLKTLKELVQEAHKHNIKVVVDFVVNHIAPLFFYDLNHNGKPDCNVNGRSEYDPPYNPNGVKDIYGDPAPIVWIQQKEINRIPPEPKVFQKSSSYHRMGRINNWKTSKEFKDSERENQVIFGDFPGGLKDIATEQKEVQNELINIANYWIDQTNIDGFRLDAVKHVEHSFWQHFVPAVRNHALKRGKTNFFLFGEVFGSDDTLTGSYTFHNELDSVLHFSLKHVLRQVFKHGKPTALFNQLEHDRKKHYCSLEKSDECSLTIKYHQTAPNELLITFIDNHDLPRFLKSSAPHSKKMLKLALLYLFTAPGIPSLYYGTEQGFDGGISANNRENLSKSGYKTDGDLFQYIKRLIMMRKHFKPLTNGRYQLLSTESAQIDKPNGGLLMFQRSFSNREMLVIINANPKYKRSINIPRGVYQLVFPQYGKKYQQRVVLTPLTAVVLEKVK